MSKNNIKKSLFSRLRNNFIAGIVVLIPLGLTLYLTLFIVKISGKLIPKGINPNHYLPFDIPGVEIIIALFLITFTGWVSLSFLGKKFLTEPGLISRALNFKLNKFETINKKIKQ